MSEVLFWQTLFIIENCCGHLFIEFQILTETFWFENISKFCLSWNGNLLTDNFKTTSCTADRQKYLQINFQFFVWIFFLLISLQNFKSKKPSKANCKMCFSVLICNQVLLWTDKKGYPSYANVIIHFVMLIIFPIRPQKIKRENARLSPSSDNVLFLCFYHPFVPPWLCFLYLSVSVVDVKRANFSLLTLFVSYFLSYQVVITSASDTNCNCTWALKIDGKLKLPQKTSTN